MAILRRLRNLFRRQDDRPAPQIAPAPRVRMPDWAALSGRAAALGALRKKGSDKPANPFVWPSFPPGVRPPDSIVAADEANVTPTMTWAGSINPGMFGGITFIGYPVLAELAQLPEYRSIHEIIATEATRKWIKIQAANGKDGADKTSKIAEIEAEFVRLAVRDCFRRLSEQDSRFGRAHLYVDTGETKNAAELSLPLGDGVNETSRLKFEKGSLRKLKTVEAQWCYPTAYNANDPLSDDWYKPDIWYVMGKSVHRSRLLTFVAREVPDLLKPAYSFGGLSMSQMVKPYVDNWTDTRDAITDLIKAFSVFVLKTRMNLTGSNPEAERQLMDRISFFNATRDNLGVMAIDKEGEDFANVAAQLSGLSQLQSQAQEHQASITRIPIVKLLGIQPAGLNASSEGEITSFEDAIHAYQESFYRPNLTVVFNLAQRNIWGEVDPDINFMFEPIGELDETQRATLREIEARTGTILLANKVITPEEERKRVAADENTAYAGLEENVKPGYTPMERVTAAATLAQAVSAAYDQTILPLGTAMRILKENSSVFSGIADQDIADAEANPPAPVGVSPEMESAEAKLEAAKAKEQEVEAAA